MVRPNNEAESYEDDNVEEECETEGCECCDGTEDLSVVSTKVEAMLELLIEKKIITEAEFERKYDEICERECDSEEEAEDEE